MAGRPGSAPLLPGLLMTSLPAGGRHRDASAELGRLWPAPAAAGFSMNDGLLFEGDAGGAQAVTQGQVLGPHREQVLAVGVGNGAGRRREPRRRTARGARPDPARRRAGSVRIDSREPPGRGRTGRVPRTLRRMAAARLSSRHHADCVNCDGCFTQGSANLHVSRCQARNTHPCAWQRPRHLRSWRLDLAYPHRRCRRPPRRQRDVTRARPPRSHHRARQRPAIVQGTPGASAAGPTVVRKKKKEAATSRRSRVRGWATG